MGLVGESQGVRVAVSSRAVLIYCKYAVTQSDRQGVSGFDASEHSALRLPRRLGHHADESHGSGYPGIFPRHSLR